MEINKGHLIALATAFVSGCSVFYNSFAVKSTADPVLFAAMKNALAAFMLIGLVVFAGNYKEILSFKRKQWLSLLFIAIIGGSIPFALFFTGMSIVSNASVSSFIFRCMFFAAAGMAVIFLKEKLRVTAIFGVLVLLAANALLLKGFAFGIGETLVLAATLMWAAESIIAKKALEGISPSMLAAARLGLGSALLLGALAVFGKLDASSITVVSSLPAILSSVFMFLYISLWYRALANSSVTESTAILAAGGIITTALNFAFAGKAPTPIEGISLLLVAFGVVLVIGVSPIDKALSGAKNLFSKRPAPWKA